LLKRFLLALLFLLHVAASAAPEDDLAVMTKALPSDVRAFIDRKGACHHWADEEPYNAARAREIGRAITQLKCDTLDAEETALKRRHAKDARAAKVFALADALYQ
jgi:hypothetical protein